MTPQDLIAAFETLAEAPEGVARLRELVLQLAVRGKLVPQDPADEPASVLLERIAAEKARLVKEKKIRKPKKLPPIEADEVPFEAPEGWAWIRFEFAHRKLGAGSTPLGGKTAYVACGTPFLRSQNVWNDGLKLDGVARIPAEIHERMRRTTVRPNDVLLNITGASIARAAVVPSDFAEANVSQHVAIVRQVESRMNRWVHAVLTSPFGYRLIMEVQVGASREGLSMKRLKEFPLPVPPLAEQHRIVARVDELMGLLDRLEAARDGREATRVALRDAAFADLRDADDAEAVEAAWARVAEQMDDLFTHPDDVAPLRQTILQLAVRGRLVPQDPTDEPASVLLERIAEEKARLVKEKKIRKPKALPPIEVDEVPFEAPEGWGWCRLGAVLTGTGAGWSPRCPSESTETDTEWGVLKTTSVQRNVFLPEYHKRLPAGLSPRPELEVREGDLLVTRAGPWFRTGVAAVVGFCRRRLMLSDKLIRCSFFAASPVARWVALAINDGPGADFLRSKQTGMDQAQVNISQSRLHNMPLSLPPVSEQRRIVARVDELMGLCDTLEERLRAAVEAQAGFAAAAVHHLEA